ncbi:GNAT family N-acetyltransferase [Paenibacillus alvei]|uniref:GNAT family N-acetyltransferase n=1 Tax=Paenibacillus alvei TaxID=44250 RepID=UPI0013DACC62|nr:GNAT family N-acetyltransferase [Paenibacillus alvei]NEZ41722.1 N-acetyltransferase [Paenibacillus alvei]
MQIRLAKWEETPAIIRFFSNTIDLRHDGMASGELYCPDGVAAAIRRKQLLVAVSGLRIAGALRLYPRKGSERISLYQFAVAKTYRGQHLLQRMLDTLSPHPIEAACPAQSSFNAYYEHNGWALEGASETRNRWVLYV